MPHDYASIQNSNEDRAEQEAVEQTKPSAAAMRIAESVTELLRGYSVTNYLPPIDTAIAADAEIQPLLAENERLRKALQKAADALMKVADDASCIEEWADLRQEVLARVNEDVMAADAALKQTPSDAA